MFNILNIDQYTCISTGISVLGLKRYGKFSFFGSYFGPTSSDIISHVAVYRIINKMENIAKINILPFFNLFDLDPLNRTL